jgi:hypothetical protein
VWFTYEAGATHHHGKLSVNSYSSLSEIQVGDQFDIQFNPKRPGRFYSLEAQSPFDDIRMVIIGVGLVFVAWLVLAHLLSR